MALEVEGGLLPNDDIPKEASVHIDRQTDSHTIHESKWLRPFLDERRWLMRLLRRPTLSEPDRREGGIMVLDPVISVPPSENPCKDRSYSAMLGNIQLHHGNLQDLYTGVSSSQKNELNRYLRFQWKDNNDYWNIDMRNIMDRSYSRAVGRESKIITTADAALSMLLLREFFKQNPQASGLISTVGGKTNIHMANFAKKLGARVFDTSNDEEKIVLFTTSEITSRETAKKLVREFVKADDILYRRFGKKFFIKDFDLTSLKVNKPE